MRAAPPAAPSPGVAWSTAAFAYKVSRASSWRCEVSHERIAVRWLGARLAERCIDAPFSIDTVTWVPRARAGAPREASTRCAARACRRGRHRTECKTTLTRDKGLRKLERAAAERRAVRGCFRWDPSPKRTSWSSMTLQPRRDVDCRRACVHALGAREVLTATVARTPRRESRLAALSIPWRRMNEEYA